MSIVTKASGDCLPAEGKSEGVLVGHFILDSLPPSGGPLHNRGTNLTTNVRDAIGRKRPQATTDIGALERPTLNAP